MKLQQGASAFLLAIALVGCSRSDREKLKDDVQAAQQKASEAADATKKAYDATAAKTREMAGEVASGTRKAVDTTKDLTKDAADKTAKAAKKAVDKSKQAAKDVTDKVNQ